MIVTDCYFIIVKEMLQSYTKKLCFTEYCYFTCLQAPMGMYPQAQYGNQPGMMQTGMYPMQNQMNAPMTTQDPFGPVPSSQVSSIFPYLFSI